MSVEEFESILKEIPTLKAPGVSGSRIKRLTDIAVKNVDQESKIITTLYANCKAVPSSHKLGVVYVVDSIVRGYTTEAKQRNQAINSLAPEGSYGAAVYKISELIESILDDALELQISQSQITKISKVVDIWERAETFDPEILKAIRSKHFVSTTPPGTPPRSKVEPVKPTAGSDQGSNSILSALASLAKSNSSSNTPTSSAAETVKPESNANNILSQLSALSGANNGSAQPSYPTQSQPQAPSAPAGNEQLIFNMLQQMQGGNSAPPAPAGNGLPPQPPRQDYSNDRRGRDSGADAYSRRNRSRSPRRGGENQYGRRDRSPPRNQQYGNFQQGLPQQSQQQQFQQQFQQQLQNGGFNPQLAAGEMNIEGTPHYRPRNVGFDPTLPQGSFKVLSRTLFIGGVPRTMDEQALSSVLRPYAEVQSVILNSERKHAFIKVYSRREAEQVITSFNKDNSLPLRTRWGVGFGPRDCCNYQHGISVIPIQRLTDADKTWVVQAQWGGTGGQPLSSGMVIDEPDIEIGAGISSKAMSKKMPTNSARNGPKSNKPGEPDEDYVKTTLIPQQNIAANMSHGSQPDFSTFSQSSVNPLSGLFANSNNPPQQPPAGLPPYPGMPGQAPPSFMPQGQAPPNLSAQLANLFQNGGINPQGQ
ncbi:uncharacterized protein CANTADRAFT_46203 [Suhomyces tanzawaensis NRRL Y-17324]|uniref:Uncharacterized protein n=1 Tax=Suhomyces tanzawaensis NRRL Y-17324 TaxID=984487 RepID=A0A1E4SQ43_9ASCO|nr:uncharacterized protein CANTADRAFT_46203 [Suhomyces tanzawaensis NRRL Y-17324]ODV81619.1 hypothetical protein CANTADRAFT_46203 [Suhomyces tanzawaensis NRRL Y-17324]